MRVKPGFSVVVASDVEDKEFTFQGAFAKVQVTLVAGTPTIFRTEVAKQLADKYAEIEIVKGARGATYPTRMIFHNPRNRSLARQKWRANDNRHPKNSRPESPSHAEAGRNI